MDTVRILNKKMSRVNVPRKILIGEVQLIEKNIPNFFKFTIENEGWVGECLFVEREVNFVGLGINFFYEIQLLFAKDAESLRSHKVLRNDMHNYDPKKRKFKHIAETKLDSTIGEFVIKLNDVPLFLEVGSDSQMGKAYYSYKDDKLSAVLINLEFDKEECFFYDFENFCKMFKKYFKEI